MTKSSSQLTWCVVRLGEDMNWWVHEISDNIHWDVDSLSIVDPRQMSHILDLMDPLREYGLQMDLVNSAFYKFKIDKDLGDKKVRLVRTSQSIIDTDEAIFALPDILDEEKGPYADLLNHITRLRVKLLNDMIDFDHPLTIDELEEAIQEDQHNNFLEGRSTHAFSEILSILEYIPHGYEQTLEDEEKRRSSSEDDIGEDIPDLDEDETLEADETMRWDEDEDEDESEDEEESEEAREEDLDYSKR